MADPWVITPVEKLKHHEQFQGLGPVGGFITGAQAKGFFLQSQLPPQVLGVIWMLADMDGDGKMNHCEFSIACKLINLKLRGFNLPNVLPPSLKQSALLTPQQAASIPPSAPAQVQPVMQSAPVAAPGVPAQPAPQVMAQGNFQPPAQVPSGIPGGAAPDTQAAQTYSSTTLPKVPVQEAAEWGVPQASKLKFTQVFNMSDKGKSGYISGVQARNILIQSNLPQAMLAQIWSLSDVDNDGKLSCEEFVLALYLCEQAKAGKPVPSALPPILIPPSMRRSRTSSVHSQGSAAGVVSVDPTLSPTSQNSLDNSFEDKRKENFEKGQAELERRRKVLLDAQRRETEERLRREREEELKREKSRMEAERKRQEELEREMQRQKEAEALKDMERKRLEETREQARKEAERQRQDEWEKQRLLELMNVRQGHQESLLALKAKNQSLTIEVTAKEDQVKELTKKISETRVAVTEVKATIDNMRNVRDKHMSDMNALKSQAKEQNQRLLNLNQEKARLKARSLASAGVGGAETAAVETSIASKKLIIKQLQEKLTELEDEFKKKEEDVNNNVLEFQTEKDQFRLTGERCTELYDEYLEKRTQVLSLREKLLNPDIAWGDTDGNKWSVEEEVVTGVTEGEKRWFCALYPFEARNEDELAFDQGDVIEVSASEGAEPGWLAGILNGKSGWFPEAYCEPCEEEQEVAPTAAFTTQSSLTKADTITEPTISPQPSVDAVVFGQMVAIYSWSGQRINHLMFTKGDKINVKSKLDDWLYGESNGNEGWFPRTYVRNVTSPLTSPTQPPEIPPLPDQINHDEITQYYLAVYPYQSEEPGDLIFEAGETVIVTKKEGDWWYGVIGERYGIFPSNYVQLVPNQSVAEKKVDVEESPLHVSEEPAPVEELPFDNAAETYQEVTNDIQEKTKKLPVAQVIAPYDATTNNQLSLVRGQLISIRKKTSSGWWEGELHAKGKKREVGWFPASYVKVMVGSSRTTPVSMEMTGRDDYSIGFTEGDLADAFSNKSMNINKPNIIPPSEPETVEALYPYTAINDDELSFEPGDVIFVLDKEDSAWWKGSLRGVIGVFPSNYVKEKSAARIIDKPITIASPDAEDSLCSDQTTSSSFDVKLPNGDKRNRLTVYDGFASPGEALRQNIITELISTEHSYLDDLTLVQKAFILPMRNSGVVSAKDIELIFINWDELVLVSSSFKKALKVRRKNAVDGNIHMISDILCQHMSQLRPYMRFCSLQSKGAELLNIKFQEESVWSEVVRRCQNQHEVAGHTLSSFLLKPMQRLLKYPLLIEKLLLNTPPNHPDHQNTLEAFHAAKTLCEQVNESVRLQDNTDKLEWMQSHINCENLTERIVFNSLTNFLGPRKLLLMGLLHKTKSRRELVVFLLNDFLLLTTPGKVIGSPPSLLTFERLLTDVTCTMYKKPMFLSELSVVADQDSESGFQVSVPGIEIGLSAKGLNDRSKWLKEISLAKKHIEDTERSRTHRMQSKEKESIIVGRVILSIMCGSSLINPSSGVLHSFCEISLGSQVQRTKVCSSPHPKWDTPMQFLVKSLSEDVLCITVYEKGFFRPNEFLGRAEIQVQSIYETSGDSPSPMVVRIPLQEVRKGEVELKYSLQLFQ